MELHVRKVASRNLNLPMSAILCLPIVRKNEMEVFICEKRMQCQSGAQNMRQCRVILTNLPLDSNHYRGKGCM